jgi:hypothetical protein
MREIRLSGSVEGVVSDHDPYSDSQKSQQHSGTCYFSSDDLLVLITASRSGCFLLRHTERVAKYQLQTSSEMRAFRSIEYRVE